MTLRLTDEEAYYVANCIMYAQEHAKWAHEHSPLGESALNQLSKVAW